MSVITEQAITKTVSYVVPVPVVLWIDREAARRGISKSRFVTELLEAAKAAENDAPKEQAA